MSFIEFTPIGTIHSPHEKSASTPIQPVFSQGIPGHVEVFAPFAPDLKDLDGFSHIHLIFHLDRARETKLLSTPYMQDEVHGVFATRSPKRPNKIGISLVRLKSIKGHVLHIEDVDILDGTPLLDIKPFCPRFDHRENVRCGWMERVPDDVARERGQRKI